MVSNQVSQSANQSSQSVSQFYYCCCCCCCRILKFNLNWEKFSLCVKQARLCLRAALFDRQWNSLFLRFRIKLKLSQTVTERIASRCGDSVSQCWLTEWMEKRAIKCGGESWSWIDYKVWIDGQKKCPSAIEQQCQWQVQVWGEEKEKKDVPHAIKAQFNSRGDGKWKKAEKERSTLASAFTSQSVREQKKLDCQLNCSANAKYKSNNVQSDWGRKESAPPHRWWARRIPGKKLPPNSVKQNQNWDTIDPEIFAACLSTASTTSTSSIISTPVIVL